MLSQTQNRPADPEPLVAAFLAALRSGGVASPAEAAFLAAIAQDYRPEELPQVTLTELGWRAAQLWSFAAGEVGPEPAIRVVPATDEGGRTLGADLVEIVQPDAPFLVDSVMG